MADDEAHLLSVSPKSFIAERDALVKRLKEAGQAERAKVVAKLAKPAASVWAVNRLAHYAVEELRQLLDAAAAVRAAERALLDGGDAQAYLHAGREERAAIAGLVERARGELESEGLAASPAVLRRIASTLHVAATSADAEVRAQLERGTLRSDLEATAGFPMDGQAPAPHARAPVVDEKAAERARLEEAARKALAELERAQAALQSAEQVVAHLEMKAAAAEAMAVKLRAEAGEARAHADGQRRETERLAQAARVAEDALSK
jgi:hypothetical protein